MTHLLILTFLQLQQNDDQDVIVNSHFVLGNVNHTNTNITQENFIILFSAQTSFMKESFFCKFEKKVLILINILILIFFDSYGISFNDFVHFHFYFDVVLYLNLNMKIESKDSNNISIKL